MENTSEKKYLTLIQKVGYGVGDLGSNYCWTFVASFIMIYCTNTLGIRSGVIGVIMMLSKFLDGVSDVIMGRIIDRTKSKMGKARFWYALSAFPVAFFTFLLFNVPSGFTKNTQYVYIFIAYTLMGVVFTLINITKDFNRSENIKEIEKRIIKLKDDTDRLDDRYGKVMKNLSTLEKSLRELEISKDKISKTINQAYDGAIEEE